MSTLSSEILEVARGIVESCDDGALASRALMQRTDVSPELLQLLTELRGFIIEIRAEAHKLKGLVGAANMTAQLVPSVPSSPQRVPTDLELPLITDTQQRVPTGHPPRHAPVLCGKDLAAGEHEDR